MSIWTYVYGSFEGVAGDVDLELELGKTVDFGDGSDEEQFNKGIAQMQEWYEHPEFFAPTGSEGSVEYTRKKTTVLVSGNLRDFWNDAELFKWIQRSFGRLHAKKATFVIECGYRTEITIKA